MKSYVQLTLAQLRLFMRNRQVIFWTLLFPLFMMFLFGSFVGQRGGITVTGGVIDFDQSKYSKQVITRLAENPGITLIPLTDEKEASSQLQQGEISFYILFQRGMGNQIDEDLKGKGTKANHPIKLRYTSSNMTLTQMLIAIVEGTVDQLNKEWLGYTPLLTVEKEQIDILPLSYIDFLIPGILALMIMNTNLNGVAGTIASWRERGILRRFRVTPLPSWVFIGSQLSARLLLNGVQAFIVLLIGFFVYGTHVYGSWMILILFILVGTAAFMAIGFMIASLAKSPESANPIAGFISFPMLFLGGVFFPIQDLPAFLTPIIKIIPITYLTEGMRRVMNEGALIQDVWTDLLVLLLWLIGSFIISSKTFRWQ
ncbi:ABC transporter permease [Microaerobacter geothermalis]|uniref:ABC transporter permease n=1 Tax=Microaerobacter geothermalis TaxID=674972 RepID=UPI001F24FC97|nr:ABC transporter permease [Microaerobacter geothermalis]MCF6093764.1 ABC transporter permease [Microaerobacter geothermalis]